MILHIGYSKAGSSFIQDEILARTDTHNIISNEGMAFDWSPVSPQEPAWVKAPRLAEQCPNARIILVIRHPGEWLESWWRHHTRGLSEIGCLHRWKATRTDFFERCIVPHLYWVNVHNEFSKYFSDIRVLRYSTLRENPILFVQKFCDACDIPVPEGIQYRIVNKSRSHVWCWLRVWFNRAWLKFGPRRLDNAYLHAMKHYFSRLDGLVQKIRR